MVFDFEFVGFDFGEVENGVEQREPGLAAGGYAFRIIALSFVEIRIHQ